MPSKKKQIRNQFREAVFERDRYCCRVCGVPGKDRQGSDKHLRFHRGLDVEFVELDSHHITPRESMPNGGYVVENGISLCSDCHVNAELSINEVDPIEGFATDELYDLIGSSYEVAVKASERLG